MNIRKLLVLFLLAGLTATYSQNFMDRKGSVSFFFEGGYNTYDLKEISDFYTEVVSSFSAHNIPVKTQKLFPASGIYGGGMSFNVENNLDVRLGLHYTGTRASSFLEDYTGKYDITGEIESYNVNIGVQKRVAISLAFTALAELNMGYFICGSSIKEKITLIDEIVEEEIDFSTFGFYMQPALGGYYNVQPLRLYIKSGYKFLVLQEEEYGDDSPEIDMSGFFIVSGISFMLY